MPHRYIQIVFYDTLYLAETPLGGCFRIALPISKAGLLTLANLAIGALRTSPSYRIPLLQVSNEEIATLSTGLMYSLSEAEFRDQCYKTFYGCNKQECLSLAAFSSPV